MTVRWTKEKVKEFTDWQQSIIYGPKIKLKHKLDSEFLMMLWQNQTTDDSSIANFFISELYKADANDIIIDITGSKYVQYTDDIKCQGYFDSTNKTLASATGYTKISHWLMTLVHESCHMDQFLENHKLWNEFDRIVDLDSWLAGKDFSKKKIHHAIDTTQALELDCEIRSIAKIKKFGLPIDLDEYIKKANSYVFFYQYLKESREWPRPPKSPYGNKIWPKMPNEILPKEQYLLLPEKYRKLYKKHL